MGVILFIIATIFTSLLTVVYIPIVVVYHLLTLKFVTGLKQIDRYFYQMALSLDQFGNVSLQVPLNLIMLKGTDVHLFGDEDDTVSYVIAINRNLETLSKFGKFIGWFLDLVDKDHLDKAIVNKYNRDLEAVERINNKYKIT